jgi:hypothetical protein
MACRGGYLALLESEALTLLALESVDDRLEYLNSLYETADSDGRQLTVDKSWDAMHRVLCGGWLDSEHGDIELRSCVIGGQQLSEWDGHIISYVPSAMVARVAAEIQRITEPWFRQRYFSLDRLPSDSGAMRYDYPLSDEDFEYAWVYFQEVQQFYQNAARRGLAVVFDVDQ